MRLPALPRVIILVILLVFLITPVQAQDLEFVISQFVSSVPAYQMTARDHISRGDQMSAECSKYTDLFLGRMAQYAYDECIILKGNNCTNIDKEKLRDARARMTLHSMGIHEQNDPIASGYKSAADEYCGLAEKHYNMALGMTPKKEYEQQAEIWERAGILYHTQGYYESEKIINKAAATAHGRAVASSIFV
ncbi:MAG: hypothetical protein WAK10_07445, partial [Methanoregula sp.]